MTVIAESFSAFARSLLAARPSKSSVIVPSPSLQLERYPSGHARELDIALVHTCSARTWWYTCSMLIDAM